MSNQSFKIKHGLNVNGNVVVSGNIDGRDISVDGSKLDGIEVGATADMSAGEIKTAYESNAGVESFTTSEQTKLSGIEAGANNYTYPYTVDQSTATTSSPTFAGLNIGTLDCGGL